MTRTPVHLEGMGWLGSALAYTLHRQGTPFTWHDTGRTINAWSASTGAVYPAGDERSQAGLTAWQHWHHTRLLPAGTTAECAYIYRQKSPPHSGPYTGRPLPGGLHIAPVSAYTADVPAIVHAAREQFAHCRLDAPPARAPVVVAHGFNHRRTTHMWGWSAPVRLHLPTAWEEAAAGRRIILYGREHRFHIVYAYPIPTRPGWWWAGSALVHQTTPRQVATAGYLERWTQAAPKLYPGIKVLEVEPPVHGWRPRPAAGDPQHLQTSPRRAVMPPLWHSGVRWAPPLIHQAAQWAKDRTP
ncbi:hypothetical protein RM572_00465 [Streptomyces sp. DSM 42041]|uniref:FAD dependent oxidoreductase n=1 Tax=Streptomyces hazeniae TaxID=3075538 RepID=A0ABU2NJS7_9ACTN|nr:hypothetical protein [Streptomyces sp. DSM 42041]MDT0377249.1 hypothetical protein [Streptomyces sp. DSM 42041]